MSILLHPFFAEALVGRRAPKCIRLRLRCQTTVAILRRFDRSRLVVGV